MKVQLAGMKKKEGKRNLGKKFKGGKSREGMGKKRAKKQNSPELNLSRESQ